MKILFHTEHFYPSIGGIETFAMNLATFLHEQGHDLDLVTETPFAGDEIVPFTILRNPSSPELRQLVREADLVYVNGYRASVFLFAGLFRKPTIVVYHDVTMICPKGTKMKGDAPCMVDMSLSECIPCLHQAGELKIFRRLFRPQIKALMSYFVAANVCTSRFSMETYRLGKKRHINYGIDTQQFAPATTPPPSDPVRLLFVGRLVPEKGCQLLIRATRTLRDRGYDVVTSICGDGVMRPQLERMVDRLKLSDAIVFHGALRGEDLVRAMQQAHIAVVPSLWVEQFGMTAVEAMSCGLPVVGSRVGGLRWTVEEAGLGFERGVINGLLEHLEFLLDNPREREEMGRRARAVAVEKYDLQAMYDGHSQLIAELVGKTGSDR